MAHALAAIYLFIFVSFVIWAVGHFGVETALYFVAMNMLSFFAGYLTRVINQGV
jgi:hypothetical protein